MPPKKDITEIESLDGIVPPVIKDEETTKEITELVDEKESAPHITHWISSNWGPWRRFRAYRQFRRDDKDDIWEKHDQKDNDIGKLPDTEHVQVPAIWVAELYTPSNVDGLFRGIKKLKWEHGRLHNNDLLKWMSDVRQGRSAGWTSLGWVSNPQNASIMSDRTASLPKGVSASLPILMSLTPSITALVMEFMFDEATADSLDSSLKADYTTKRTRRTHLRPWHTLSYILFNTVSPLGRSIYGPDSQRIAAVQSSLCKLEKGCVHWMHKNLPGVFASNLKGKLSPTALLLVTDVNAPLDKDSRLIRSFQGLSIDRDFDAWESEEWPHARLALPRTWDKEGLRLTFACRRHDAFPESPGYENPTSNSTIALRANDRIRGLLSRWALSCMLDGYHEQLSDLRDNSATRHTYKPIRDMKKLRTLVRTKLYDILTSSSEIEKFTDADRAYKHEVIEMQYVRSPKDARRELLSDLRFSQRHRAKQVRHEANLLQSVLSVSSEVSQTISNIRIQRFVVLLTVVSISIALFAVSLTTNATP